MLTALQVREIVNYCLAMLGFTAATSDTRLKTLGIDNGSTLKLFKLMLVNEIERYGYSIGETHLTFSRDSTINEVNSIVAGAAEPSIDVLQLSVKSRPHRRKRSVTLGRTKAAKAKPGGRSPRAAKLRSRRQHKRKQTQQTLTRLVESTPHLEFWKTLIPNRAYRMAVFVDRKPADHDADVKPVNVKVAVNVQDFPLDVWLDCSSHFRVEHMDRPRITVLAKSGVSDELHFTLKVLTTDDDKPMYVSAFFRYNDRPCGKVTRYPEVVNGTLRWKTFARDTNQKGAVVLPNVNALPSVAIEAQSHRADIRVEVLRKAKDGLVFHVNCHTKHGKWEGPWTLSSATKDLVKFYMQRFMTNEGEARITSLQSAGMDLWDTLPAPVKELLWDALDTGARTMSVISEEPYIPWELIVPYKRVANPRQPLGVCLQLGRWITGNYKSARQRVPMKNGYVVSPKTSGLGSAAEEVAFLQQLKPEFDPVDVVVPASFAGVNKGLGGPARNVIHFICHGKNAVLQTLELDKPDTLDCSQVRALKGFQIAFKNGPLAFLNACEVGGQVMALDGMGGFANSFIELGASAVIAPLWPVQDKVALDVTRRFYRQALKGVPFAKILKQIRVQAYDQAIDSYAAYCFYGDPMASSALK